MQPAIELDNIALGAMGCRVLSTALLGVGPGLTGGAPPGGGVADGIDPPIPSCPYQCLQALSLESCRIWGMHRYAAASTLTELRAVVASCGGDESLELFEANTSERPPLRVAASVAVAVSIATAQSGS